MDGPRVSEGPPLHQQVRRLELRGPAVGDGHPWGRPLPRGPARETHPPPGGGLQDEQTKTLLSEHVNTITVQSSNPVGFIQYCWRVLSWTLFFYLIMSLISAQSLESFLFMNRNLKI